MEIATIKFNTIGEYVCAHSDSNVPTKLVYMGHEYETLAISESGRAGVYRRND